MFDLGFVNAELDRCKRALLARERIIDTLMLARRKHSAGPYSLDALCQRYGINNSKRTKHGALLDAELLAEVYLELSGKRQASLGLIDEVRQSAQTGYGITVVQVRATPLAPRLTQAELDEHRAFVASLGDKAIWNEYRAA